MLQMFPYIWELCVKSYYISNAVIETLQRLASDLNDPNGFHNIHSGKAILCYGHLIQT